jgi:hypothetical protein
MFILFKRASQHSHAHIFPHEHAFIIIDQHDLRLSINMIYASCVGRIVHAGPSISTNIKYYSGHVPSACTFGQRFMKGAHLHIWRHYWLLKWSLNLNLPTGIIYYYIYKDHLRQLRFLQLLISFWDLPIFCCGCFGWIEKLYHRVFSTF